MVVIEAKVVSSIEELVRVQAKEAKGERMNFGLRGRKDEANV